MATMKHQGKPGDTLPVFASRDGLPALAIPEGGRLPSPPPLLSSKEVGSFGRVSTTEGASLHAKPGEPLQKTLPFNTRLFVGRELSSGWYFVALDDGSFGYVNIKDMAIHPPEPGAFLHRIKPGESALQIVKQYYKSDALGWGHDERYYVNILVEANRGKGLRGIYKPSALSDWSQTRTRQDYLIWIPSIEFARSLRGKVWSGSISYELWRTTTAAARAVGDYYLGSTAFFAGIIHGALESVWDLLTGLIDLVELVWKVLESLFSGQLFSDLKGLWDLATSLNLKTLVEVGLKEFLGRWNSPDLLRKWHFRGWVLGYALAEILMAVFTEGLTLVKWVGKTGKLGQLLAKSPTVVKLANKVKHLSISIPESARKRLKGILLRHARHVPDEFVGYLRGQRVILRGVKLVRLTYTKRNRMLYEQLRNAFTRVGTGVRANFSRSLAADHGKVAQLKKAGLTDIEIAMLKDGRVPPGYQVHHKLPLDDGGTNDFSNLVLIKNDPYHLVLSNRQAELTRGMSVGETRVLDYPMVDGFIYPP